MPRKVLPCWSRRPRTGPEVVCTSGGYEEAIRPSPSQRAGGAGTARSRSVAAERCPLLDREGVRVAGDLQGAVPAEVGGEHERGVVGAPAQPLPAGGPGSCRVLAEAAVVVRFHHL